MPPRREETRSERAGVPTDGPKHPWPSEIAKANRQKQAEQSHGRTNGRDKSHGHVMGTRCDGKPKMADEKANDVAATRNEIAGSKQGTYLRVGPER